jgi:hypothetical protein
MIEPDAATCRAALMLLLHGMPVEQQAHAARFLLRETEQLYVSGRCPPPAWIGELRYELSM